MTLGVAAAKDAGLAGKGDYYREAEREVDEVEGEVEVEEEVVGEGEVVVAESVAQAAQEQLVLRRKRAIVAMGDDLEEVVVPCSKKARGEEDVLGLGFVFDEEPKTAVVAKGRLADWETEMKNNLLIMSRGLAEMTPAVAVLVHGQQRHEEMLRAQGEQLKELNAKVGQILAGGNRVAGVISEVQQQQHAQVRAEVRQVRAAQPVDNKHRALLEVLGRFGVKTEAGLTAFFPVVVEDEKVIVVCLPLLTALVKQIHACRNAGLVTEKDIVETLDSLPGKIFAMEQVVVDKAFSLFPVREYASGSKASKLSKTFRVYEYQVFMGLITTARRERPSLGNPVFKWKMGQMCMWNQESGMALKWGLPANIRRLRRDFNAEYALMALFFHQVPNANQQLPHEGGVEEEDDEEEEGEKDEEEGEEEEEKEGEDDETE